MSQSKQLALQSRQLTKLKQLLKRYRHVKLAQSSLLQLSELASTVSDMNRFYPALTDVIEPLFNTKSFHIVLLNSWAELELAYCNNPDDNIHFAQFNADDWANTLTGKVYSSQKLLQYDAKSQQALAQAGEVTLVGAQSCKTWMGAPLVRGQQVIGVFAIKNYQSTEEDSIRYQQLLSFISDYIVIAIDRVRSRELLELNILQRTKKLTATNQQLQIEIAERQKSENIHKALLHISEITANCDDDYQIFQQIHQIVKTLMFADNFYIALVDNDNEGIHFPYYSDEKQTLAQTQKSDIGLTEFIIRLAKPALISGKQVNILHHDGSVEQRAFNERNNKELKVVSWLGAPLIVQDKVIGVIAIQSYRATQNYEKSDIELIRFFSQHIATAIHRNKTALELKRHNEQLEQLVSNRTFELEKSNSNLRLQVEERRRAEERLYFEAHHDALTKLPNRNMFADRLNQAIKHVRRHTTNRFAVLFIDLDRFKLINDTLGHHAGDEFLIEIAHRVGHCVRDNDILARLGGDEFVILLDSIQHADDAEEIACRVIEAIQKPFKIQEQTLHSNASIGIAICDKNYRNADELLRDADAAMYQAKAMGRGRYVFFDESMREQLLASMTLEQELRLAVKEQQFELKFQDISDLKHDNIAIGVEAFLRWQHPTQGELAPDEFIAMAEEIGLIIDIEHWVIEQVGQQLARWKTQPQHANSFISINLSGKHIAQPTQLNELVKKIKQCIAEPQRLILEFTERAFSHSSHEQLMHSMRKLKKLGVKLALDDYGSGLSSLNFINNYSFEFIKLDKSFIKTLNTSAKNLALVGSLTQLGNNFGFRIVAEGIENKDVMDKLKSVGCEYGQGYFISTPAHIKQDKSDDAADIASCA